MYSTQYPEIPWAAIVGMRNRLIQAHFDIDLDIVGIRSAQGCLNSLLCSKE
jgi:uncharacterized protein with HEPN domain